MAVPAGPRTGIARPPNLQGHASLQIPGAGIARPSSLISPAQDIQFALVRPIFGFGDQSRAHRILDHVIPLRVVTLAIAQLPVPTVPLPERLVRTMRPVTRGIPFPEANPR